MQSFRDNDFQSSHTFTACSSFRTGGRGGRCRCPSDVEWSPYVDHMPQVSLYCPPLFFLKPVSVASVLAEPPASRDAVRPLPSAVRPPGPIGKPRAEGGGRTAPLLGLVPQAASQTLSLPSPPAPHAISGGFSLQRVPGLNVSAWLTG